jgi:hypothetical protein
MAAIELQASKQRRDLSQGAPEAVYPQFEELAAQLDNPNNVLKWNAILTLANLAPVDREGKLDGLLDRYLAPIAGPVMITAANTIKGAAIIAQSKPNLAQHIAAAIMCAEHGKYATPECRNVAIGHALQALSAMKATGREVRSFAARHLDNPRPATAKKAARLLTSFESASKSRSRSS